jgi:hypothetical protein
MAADPLEAPRAATGWIIRREEKKRQRTPFEGCKQLQPATILVLSTGSRGRFVNSLSLRRYTPTASDLQEVGVSRQAELLAVLLRTAGPVRTSSSR